MSVSSKGGAFGVMRNHAGLRPVHWFFRRSDGQWAAYSDDDSDALECAYAECRHECTLSGANHKVRSMYTCVVRVPALK